MQQVVEAALSLIPQPRILIKHAGCPAFVTDAIGGGIPRDPLAWAELLMSGAIFPNDCLKRISLADWRAAHGGLPAGFCRVQGYVLSVDSAGVILAADTDGGFRHAMQTLAQLLAQAHDAVPALLIIDWPAMRQRYLHVCYHLAVDWMPVSVPNFEALIKLIKTAAHFKMNGLLLEIETMFPHKKHPALATSHAFSAEQINVIGRVCAAWGVEIIPLLQSLGHAYHVLRHAEYAHLRETPDAIQQYCPSHPDVLPLYMELAEEIRRAFPGVNKFHIGGDESRQLGVCKVCRQKAGEHGVGRLYGEHIGAVARAVMQRGLTPLVWSDIMENHPEAAGYLPKGIEFVYWKYALPRNGSTVDFKSFIHLGTVWAAAGVRFGRCNHTMFRFQDAMQGISFLATEAQRMGCDNFIITDWMKTVPFELSIIGQAYAAEMSWGARRTTAAFAADFADWNFGKRDARLADIYALLSLPLLPYCEDGEARAVDWLDRYDLSGLTFRERMARQANANTRGEIQAALQAGLANAGRALEMLNALKAQAVRECRLLDLLVLSAQTNAHKARMGLAIDDVIRVLKFPCPDDKERCRVLMEQLPALINEHDRLRSETHNLLKSVMPARNLSANLDVRFEPAGRQWLEYFLAALRSGAYLPAVFGEEAVPIFDAAGKYGSVPRTGRSAG